MKFIHALIITTFGCSVSGAVTTAIPKECFATTEDKTYNLQPCLPITDSQETWTLYLDGEPLQGIDGFGAAWTDATTFLFDQLLESDQDKLMTDLFTTKGIGMEFMRMTIGQSDLTPDSRWSFDENDGLPDKDLSNWSLTEQGERMRKWILRMGDYNPDILLLGSQWSPPGWMKQNNNLRWEFRDSYVQYFVNFLQAYMDVGVEVDAITLQNEPLHSAGEAWTMFMDSEYAAILSNNTFEAIRREGLSTKIWAFDHNTDHPEYPQYVMDNSPSVDTVAWHCYGGGFSPLKDFAAANPGVKQYMTECWLHETSGEGFFDLPQFIMRPIQNGASGSLAWTLAGSVDLDVSYPGGCEQCTGIVQVDQKVADYELTGDYYKLGQFSKFVRKGARYLHVDGDYVWDDGTGVESAAFVNTDGSTVIVMMNKFQDDLTVTLGGVDGGDVVGVVQGRSVTTWLL
jgi:glucan endo-1,6-beta-glucosidase